MPSIGGIEFITLTGDLTPIAMAAAEITRPGEDSQAYLRIGRRAPITQHNTIADVPNTGSVIVHVNACMGLRSTLVDVWDNLNIGTGEVMVVDVEHVSSRRVESPVGGIQAGNYLVTMRWRLQCTV